MREDQIWMKLLQVMDRVREIHHQEGVIERPTLHTTIAEAKVMHCILFSRNGCSIKEIADRLGITQGAASQIVEKMVRKGPLIRVPDETDRRSVRIMLSSEGMERHRQITASFRSIMRNLLDGVPPDKVKIFEEVLDHLIETKK